MRILIPVSAFLLSTFAEFSAQAQPTQVGESGGGSILSSGSQCPDSSLLVHHNGSFENGVAWTYGGVQEPYYGAFGEAFDVGPGTVECVSFWLSQDGFYSGQSTDVYVWEDGIAGDPGSVLGLVTGVVFESIAMWPDVTRHDVVIPVAVTGPVTVGSWGSWVYARNGYYWVVDYEGTGHPWTHVMWGIGWPEGWQHPEIVWGPIRSMGIGVHFTPEDPTPVQEFTWGEVKRLIGR